jgi:hypothetical protein
VEFPARDKANPSLQEVFDAVLGTTWESPYGSGCAAEIGKVVDDVALHDLMSFAANERASAQVGAIAAPRLHKLKEWLHGLQGNGSDSEQAQAFFAARQIEQFEKDPKRLDPTPPAEPPDGPPIGAMGDVDDEWQPH